MIIDANNNAIIPGKQTGIIRFGGGLNSSAKMEEMSSRGYLVIDHGEYASLHDDFKIDADEE